MAPRKVNLYMVLSIANAAKIAGKLEASFGPVSPTQWQISGDKKKLDFPRRLCYNRINRKDQE